MLLVSENQPASRPSPAIDAGCRAPAAARVKPEKIFSRRRAFARTYCERPVVFIVGGRKTVHKGLLCNYSPAGMCIASARYLESGTDVIVKIRPWHSAGERFGAGEIGHYRGKIVWCRDLGHDRPERFSAGIMFDATNIQTGTIGVKADVGGRYEPVAI